MVTGNPHSNLCGAKTKAGGLCRRKGMPNGRCQMHGGTAPTGLASPNFKHGRYSKAFGKIGKRFEESINDPALLDPRRAVATQDLIVTKCAERLADTDSPEFRKRASNLYDDVEAAARNGDAEALGPALTALGKHIRNGKAEDQALRNLSTAATKLVQQQRDYWAIALAHKASYTADEMSALLFGVTRSLLDAGIDNAQVRKALADVDDTFFDGRWGFASNSPKDIVIEGDE